MKTLVPSLVVGSCIAASSASADITIYIYNSSLTLISDLGYQDAHDYDGSDAQHPKISLPSTAAYVDIIPDSTSTNVGFLKFDAGPSSGTVRFYIGANDNSTGPDFDSADNPPSFGGHNLKGIDTTGISAESVFFGGISGDLGASGLTVDRLVRFDVGAELKGNVTATNPGNGSTPYFVVEADTMSDDSEITLFHGNITRIKTFGTTASSSGPGDLKARVIAEEGDIQRIESSGRITGYGPTPTRAKKGRINLIIAAKEIAQNTSSGTSQAMIRANEGIDSIQATYINANIDAADATDDSVTDGSIRKIVTTSTTQGTLGITKIRATKLHYAAAGDKVDVAAGFDGDIVLTSSSGLELQVILNSANNGGDWDGDITINGTTLSPTPAYEQTSGSLGGGVVGLVPFRMYVADAAFPDYDAQQPLPLLLESTLNAMETGVTVFTVPFYGPVKSSNVDPDVPPVKIVSADACEYPLDITSKFTYSVSGRTLTVKRSSNAVLPICGTYEIHQGESAKIVCDVAGLSNVEAIMGMQFHLGSDCNGNGVWDMNSVERATYDGDDDGILDSCWSGGGCYVDFNGDGFVDFFDVDAFLACFECEFCPSGRNADFNMDEFVDFHDADAFTAAYELGC